MAFYSCCCDGATGTYRCRLFLDDWDGAETHLVEVKVGVNTASTALNVAADDGTTLDFKDVEADPGDHLAWPVVPPRPNSLELATTIEWSPSDSTSAVNRRCFYLFGQTFDDLVFVPTGQDLKWWGSIDFAVRFYENRYNSQYADDLVDRWADASTFTASIVGVTPVAVGATVLCQIQVTGHRLTTGDMVDIAGIVGTTEANGPQQSVTVIDADNFQISVLFVHTYVSGGTITVRGRGSRDAVGQVRLVLIARQGSNVYYRDWDKNTDSNTYVVAGDTGVMRLMSGDGYSPVGTWYREGCHLSGYKLNTPVSPLSSGLALDSDDPPQWYIASADGVIQSDDPYTNAIGELDWCYGAPPIYFGYGVLCQLSQADEGRGYGYLGTTYRLNTQLLQTIRVDRICLNLFEQETAACPCFDTCFKSDDTGTMLHGDSFAAAAVGFGVNLVVWNPLPVGYTFGTCSFVDEGLIVCTEVTSGGGPPTVTYYRRTWLFIDKPTGRALLFFGIGCLPAFKAFACDSFTSSGGTFTQVHLLHPADYATAWATVSDLLGSGYTQGAPVTGGPSSITMTPAPCDGTSTIGTTGPGSCEGECNLTAAYVSGSSGALKWVYSSGNCSSGCDCGGMGAIVASFGHPVLITDTLTVNCGPIWNNPPAGHAGSVTTAIDTPYVFGMADFGFTDPLDIPSNNFKAVKITSLPDRGSLVLVTMVSTTAVSLNQFVEVGSLSGQFQFVPGLHDVGQTITGYTLFTFRVQDDGGTAHDASDLDTADRNMLITVTGPCQPPIGSDHNVTAYESQDFAFAASSFPFMDPHNVPANSLANVIITTLPSVGTIKLSGAAVTAGQSISASAITTGLLTFTPIQYANGLNYDHFTAQVQTNGSLGSGGSNIDPTPRTITVDVSPVSDAPIGTSNTVSTPLNTPYVFSRSDFGFSDPHDSPADSFIGVTLVTLPTTGVLSMVGNPFALVAGQSISVPVIIDAGALIWTPNTGSTSPGSFTFKVEDSGSTLHGGQIYDATARTMTINVI